MASCVSGCVCVCFTDVHSSWHAQKPHVSITSFRVCHFEASGSVSGLWPHRSEFCLSLLAHWGCWNSLYCDRWWPMVKAWTILGGIPMSHICSMSKTWFYSNSMLAFMIIACLHMCTVFLYIMLIMYSIMTLPWTVSSSAFELHFSHSWTYYVATQLGSIFFYSCWVTFVMPILPATCPNMRELSRKKEKVAPHQTEQQQSCLVCTVRCMCQSAWLHKRLSSALTRLLATSQ